LAVVWAAGEAWNSQMKFVGHSKNAPIIIGAGLVPHVIWEFTPDVPDG